jgi:hypothetical protein
MYRERESLFKLSEESAYLIDFTVFFLFRKLTDTATEILGTWVSRLGRDTNTELGVSGSKTDSNVSACSVRPS